MRPSSVKPSAESSVSMTQGLTPEPGLGEAIDRARTLPVPSAVQRNLVAFGGLSMAIGIP